MWSLDQNSQKCKSSLNVGIALWKGGDPGDACVKIFVLSLKWKHKILKLF